MAKKIKSICIDEDLVEHIEMQRRDYSFSFSDWVNATYRYHFLSVEGLVKEIEKKTREMDDLRTRLKKAKAAAVKIGKILSKNEINFILKVPILIKERKDWDSIRKRFNITFNKHLELSEFQMLVRQYDRDRNQKLQEKIAFHKRTKKKGRRQKGGRK